MTFLIVKFLAEVDVRTGVISSIYTHGGGFIPPEGVIPNTSSLKELVHILDEEKWDGKDASTILTEYFRKDGAWVHRGPPPTKHYVWNPTSEEWEYNNATFLATLRRERNRRLTLCDWTQSPDSPLSQAEVANWKAYRESLRNLPSTIVTETQDLEAVSWPTPPDGETIEIWNW